MIKVTVGNNVTRNTVIITENTTIREVLENNGVSTQTGSLMLSGAVLTPDQVDMTFADLGFRGEASATLYNVAKRDNA